MKNLGLAVLFVFLLVLSLLSCAGSPANRPAGSAGRMGITARGTADGSRLVVGPMYTGAGGRDIYLAILAPYVQGDVPDWLPLYIQGMLNNNINRFSAITLRDHHHLNTVMAEQELAASGRFSDENYIRIGHIANAQYLLVGTVLRVPGNLFSLELVIIDSSTAIRRANFMQTGTLAEFEGRGQILNEATAELFRQINIELTEAGIQTLLAGNVSAVQAEAGLARGIIAQDDGANVEAMLNFAQAATFDPAQLEALARLNTLSATISGGTISQRILMDFQLRDQWLEAFREMASFFDNHPPFQIIFDPSLIQVGEPNFARRTVDLGMRIALDPSEAGFAALNALVEGLEETGRREAWGFSGWPLADIAPRDRRAVVFGGRRSFSYRVDVALINENNQTISNGRITLETEAIRFSVGDTRVRSPNSVEGVVNFRNVRADNLTPTLTIEIIAVNRILAHDLSASGYMRIEASDLEIREQAARRAREQLEREQLERELVLQRERAQELTIQREQERRERERQERERVARQARRIANARRNTIDFSASDFWGDVEGSSVGGVWFGAGVQGSPIPYINIGLEGKFGPFFTRDPNDDDYISPMTGII